MTTFMISTAFLTNFFWAIAAVVHYAGLLQLVGVLGHSALAAGALTLLIAEVRREPSV